MVSRAGLEPATLCLKGAWTPSKASLNSILFLGFKSLIFMHPRSRR